jgi:hypothetical protein
MAAKGAKKDMKDTMEKTDAKDRSQERGDDRKKEKKECSVLRGDDAVTDRLQVSPPLVSTLTWPG